MNVCVIGGSGYVGLITGVGLAALGHSVVAVDKDVDRVARLQRGESPIYEEGVDLEALVGRMVTEGRLRYTTDLPKGIEHGEVIFIAVGTPEKSNGEADLSQVIDVAEELLRYIEGYKVIVVKSTVPVGTVELVCSILQRSKVEGEDFDIVANPEFLREGKGLFDFFSPTRIVVGTGSQRAAEVMRRLYAPFLTSCPAGEQAGAAPNDGVVPRPRQDTPLVETDVASAQMIKYASNAFLATRISFINEIASICERVKADVVEVARGMGYDPRIGHEYLDAGLGFGGPCLEKDLKALLRIARDNGYEAPVLNAVLDKNEYQVKHVIARLKELTGYLLYRKIVAIFGLAFKPGTNDVRTSLSLRIIKLLAQEGAIVRAHDPVAIAEAREMQPDGVEYCEDPYEVVRHADALLLLTDWSQYRDLDYRAIKARMSMPNIIDTRNLLDKELLESAGFRWKGVGR
ncbi:MAG: UDP-glucose dehydrogenase family protein [Chloroflexota bacterium]